MGGVASFFILVVLVLGGVSTPAAAEPVSRAFKMTFSTTLPAGSRHFFTFRLFDAAAEGTELWNETTPTRLTVSASRTIQWTLGSAVPFSSGLEGPVDFSQQLWVQYTGGGRTPARVKLPVVPYALWSLGGPAGGFSLPFSGDLDTASDAFVVSHSGTGRAGVFSIENPSSENAVLEVTQRGEGPAGVFTCESPSTNAALVASNSGNGPAGVFVIANPASGEHAVTAETDGLGSAGEFEITNSASPSAAVSGATAGTGPAGYFEITNPANGNVAVGGVTYGTGPAIFGRTTGNGNAGNFSATSPENTYSAVHAETDGKGPAALFQISNPQNQTHAVGGKTNGQGPAVLGHATGTGIAGQFLVDNPSNGSNAVYAETNGSGYALYAYSVNNHAAFLNGDVTVTGTLSKGAGAFRIDHPLDPRNKYLYHSFVESPDMKNLYDGVAVLDENGSAIVELPEWFEALNRDFRYQLTAVGAPAAGLYIAEEISGNRFTIAGGICGLRVSWQVTGIRKDAYANRHRTVVEVEKVGREQGTCLHREACEDVPEEPPLPR